MLKNITRLIVSINQVFSCLKVKCRKSLFTMIIMTCVLKNCASCTLYEIIFFIA